jgi:acyl-coenzyme A thioesterase PaaI-like protein
VAVDPVTGPEEGAVSSYGVGSWLIDGEWRHTEFDVGPDACAEGTDRPLTGVLFGQLDVVTGSPPSGVMNPTVDLQLRLFSPPRIGTVRFTARTLRLGRTLYVGEAELRHLGEDQPFGIGVATFVNLPLPFPERSDHSSGYLSAGHAENYGMLPGAHRVGTGIYELEADTNTPQGTVSGAALGRLIEMTALDLATGLLGCQAAVDELDVRFLNKVRGDLIRTTATVIGRRSGSTTLRVEVADVGNSDRLATWALAVCSPMDN